MSLAADVAVVGGGVVGASVAYHLVARGVGDVALLEGAAVPGRGATARSAGLLRMHHTTECDVPLALASHEVYANWPDAVGGDCGFRRTGFLMIVAPEHADDLRANLAVLRKHRVDTTEITVEELRELQPFCDGHGVGAVAYEPQSGYASPAKATIALVERARARGLRVFEGTTVLGLTRANGRVTGVATNIGDVAAEEVVLAASVWSAVLLRALGIEMPIRSKQIFTCLLDASPLPAAPPCCTYIDDTTGAYFRPDSGRRLMSGVPTNRWDVDVDAEPPAVEQPQLAEARDRLAARIPLMRHAEPRGTCSGFDGYTPDRHALIGRVPDVDGLYLACGFSGGGFKVAPAVGESVASELTENEPRPELELFRPTRFEDDRPIQSAFPYTHL